MIPDDLCAQITQTLFEKTGVNDWKIAGDKIESRECVIYKVSSPQYPHDIAIKAYHDTQKNDAKTQYNVLERFSNSLNKKNNEYFVPTVFGNFPNEGLVLMEWVESPSLEKRLWRYCYSKKHVQSDIRRIYMWLKEFHSHSRLEKKPVNIDSYKQTLKKYIESDREDSLLKQNQTFQLGKQCFDEVSEIHSGFKTLHANLHGDFTPSNILVDDHKITGIDIFGSQHFPVDNDIALQLSYIAIEYPNMLTRFDFKLPPSEWPLLKLILDSYVYPKEPKQLHFFLFVFLYQLLRRWIIISKRNLKRPTPLLDHWRLRNTQMIVKHLCLTLKEFDTSK